MSWKDKPFAIAGWSGLALFLLVIGVDIVFDRIKGVRTFSQYVSARAVEQPLFGIIVLGLMIFLAWHWFYRPIREWIRKWFG